MTRIHDRWLLIRTYRYFIYYMSISVRCVCNVHPAIKVPSLVFSTVPRHMSATMSFIPSKPKSYIHLKELTKPVLSFLMFLVASKNIAVSVHVDYYNNPNSCIFKLSPPVMSQVNSIHVDILVPTYLVKSDCPHLQYGQSPSYLVY